MPQTWSAYADVVSADAGRALVVRVSHDPEANRAELWVHAFIDGRLFAHMSAHACPPLAAAITGNEREQVSLDLESGGLNACVLAAETNNINFGEGTIPLIVSMQWAGAGQQGSNLPGRDEHIVKVSAVVTFEGRRLEISGWGHQHTQIQEQPRFVVPFTYLSLRGDDICFVGLLTSKFQRGFGSAKGVAMTATSVKLDPPADSRSIQIQSSTAIVTGELNRSYQYRIPMSGTRRDSSIVSGRLNGLPVTGVVNDFAGTAA